MAPWFSYSLVADAENQDGISASKQQLLEWLQPLNSFLRNIEGLAQRLHQRLRPFKHRLEPVLRHWGLWTTVFTAAILTIVAVTVVPQSLPSDETVLNFVDPLIGTAGGGMCISRVQLVVGG